LFSFFCHKELTRILIVSSFSYLVIGLIDRIVLCRIIILIIVIIAVLSLDYKKGIVWWIKDLLDLHTSKQSFPWKFLYLFFRLQFDVCNALLCNDGCYKFCYNAVVIVCNEFISARFCKTRMLSSFCLDSCLNSV
jgi:hypothetical protein